MTLKDLLCPSLQTENGRISNFFDLFARGIGNSVGVGILVLFGELIRNVAGPAVLISIAVAGIAAILTALCFSEFGVRFLKTETAYIYSYSYHGENVAFILGWALILEYIAGTASIIKGLVTFADGLANGEISNFLNETTPFNWKYDFVYFDFVSFVLVLLLVVPVAWKLTDYTILKNIFTVCTVLFYISIITAGSFKADPKTWTVDNSTEGGLKENFAYYGALGIIKGAAIVYYCFIGFETVVLTGHEVKNPHKTLPLASAISVAAVLLLNEGVATVLSLMCPLSEIIPTAALPFAFEYVGWIPVKWIIVVGAFFGFQTSVFGAIFPLPKILNAMAKDCLLFPCLSETHSKYKPGILLSALLTATLAGVLTFQNLVNLTVIAALFVSAIIAIDVIMIRYITKENASIFKSIASSSRTRATAKEVVQQMFRFNSQITTEITENAVAANLFLLCLSSTGLGIAFGIFGEEILEPKVEAIIPAVVCAVIILFSLGSISAQPKSKIFSVFKVPLVPFTPCICIFLNNFLMMFLGPVNLILFLIWMGLGIIPHLIWYSIKYCQGNVGNSSFYEINKFNLLKLSESIWKIKAEKKSFYAGSVNHAFRDDKEDSTMEVIRVTDETTGKIMQDKKNSLKLNRAVIVQTPDLSEESENPEQGTGNDEIIQWECVAEIHTEEEFQQGSYELEVVDDNYRFLSYVSEDPNRDSSGSSNKGSPRSVKSLEEPTTETKEKEININNIINEVSGEGKGNEPSKQDVHQSFAHVVKSINEGGDNKTLEKSNAAEKHIPERDVAKEKAKSPVRETPIVEEAKKVNSSNNDDNNNASSDYNKMKDFKEKLNLFLKNQINENRTYGSIYNIKSRKNSISESDKEDNVSLRGTVKTLNKSEIKDKLDIILTKGPPKRASLQNSFNIKIKHADRDNDEAATAF